MTDEEDDEAERLGEETWVEQEHWQQVHQYYQLLAQDQSRQRYLVAAVTEVRRRLPRLRVLDGESIRIIENVGYQFLVRIVK